MKRLVCSLTLTLLAASLGLPASLSAQTSTSSASSFSFGGSSASFGGSSLAPARGEINNPSPAPFSRLALSGGIGSMGINMQAAVNANRFFNIRGTGNYFGYNVTNVTINNGGGSNGISVSGTLKFATAGASLDIYPFPNHGFRLSPGAVFYNQNRATAAGATTPGSSFTFGSQTYYSDEVNPLNLAASLGLNKQKTAFSMTTGWGNLIPRRGGHFSFPFEIGAIFAGAPTIGFNATGNACTTQADAADNGPSCQNMATNPQAQANIAAQVAKYQKDLNVVPVYPIVSFGIGYNFKVR